MNRLTLAHLSDLHLPLADRRPRLRDLMSKRLFSWLSWRRSRRRIHRPEVLARVMDDVRRREGAHLVVTGDLVNLALPEEFARARDWLSAQGGPDRATVIPGNHDALVPVGWGDGLGSWSDWMADVGPDGFPFVKRIGDAVLIGLSSAVPTAPFLAGGRIGAAQMARLERILEAEGAAGRFRIVLLHHPLTDGAVPKRKALWDRDPLRAVLARAGAELVLHGHAHEPAVTTVAGPYGPIAVISAPSASAVPGWGGPPAGWALIEVEPANAAWRISVALRHLESDGGGFTTGERISLEAPRAGAAANLPAG